MVLSFRSRSFIQSSVWGKFLALSAAAGLVFAIIWNPDLTLQKDWDLFSPFLLPLLLLGAHLLARRPNQMVLVGLFLLTVINSVFFIQTFRPVKTWSPSLSVLPMPSIEYRTDVVWDENFQLLGFNMESDQGVVAGESLKLELFFRGLKQMPVGYTIFLHLTDE